MLPTTASPAIHRQRHVVGWPAYARAAVLTVGTFELLAHGAIGAFMVGSLVMGAEAAWWSVRYYAVVRGRTPHRALAVAAFVGAWIVNVARLLYAVPAVIWWGVGEPTVVVNCQRRQRAKARKDVARAERMMRHAQHPGHVAAAANLFERAKAVLERPLGLHAEELPPPPALAPAPRPVAELPAAPSAEPAQVATETVCEAEAVSLAVVHGLVTTFADGSHRFEPFASSQGDVR